MARLGIYTIYTMLAVLACSVGVVASGHDVKSENKHPKNISLSEAEERLTELKDLLTDRLMQIDQIRSELGGRKTSCTSQDQECSAYYRVTSWNQMKSFTSFKVSYLAVRTFPLRKNSTTRSQKDFTSWQDCRQDQIPSYYS